MKKALGKLIAFVMAVLVMCTTMSFTVNMHYCGKTLVDLSFFSNTKTCGMDVIQTTNLEDCDTNIAKDTCCSDHEVVVEGQDELKNTFENLELNQQLFVITFLYSYINLFEPVETKANDFNYYSPPFLERDVQSLHQVYLI